MPDRPPFITTATGERFWAEFGPQINALGLLETLDTPAFAMLCEAFAMLEDLRTQFASDRRYTIAIGENGAEQPNPLLGEIGKQVKGILQLLGEFGMTPVSRQKLTGSTSATPLDPNADPMARLFDEANNGNPQLPDLPELPKAVKKKRAAKRSPRKKTPAAKKKRPARKKPPRKRAKKTT